MEGCARRERRRAGYALAAGWHAANFGRAKQLRDLGFYLKKLEPETPQSIADEAAAVWKGFADRGLVKIREVPRADG